MDSVDSVLEKIKVPIVQVEAPVFVSEENESGLIARNIPINEENLEKINNSKRLYFFQFVEGPPMYIRGEYE